VRIMHSVQDDGLGKIVSWLLGHKGWQNFYSGNDDFEMYVPTFSCAGNNTKALLITDSFGRSMSQYLSLYFKELRYLDPQKGRYNDSYLKYIDQYKPEIVIVMNNSSINL